MQRVRRAAQRRVAHLEHQHLRAGHRRGGADGGVGPQKGHFTKADARVQGAQLPALARDVHLPFDEDAERIAGRAFAHQHGAARHAAPVAQAHQLPQGDVVEIGKERQGPQACETLGLRVLRLLARQAAREREQGVGPIRPVRKAVLRGLGQGAQHKGIDFRRQRGAQQAGRGGSIVAMR